MISAQTARAYASKEVRGTRIFKNAVKKLESRITEAAKQGKHELNLSVGLFDMPYFSSKEKDEYATDADLAEIKAFMEDYGYSFFYYKKNPNDRWCRFICRW